jgi:hypothetical protein
LMTLWASFPASWIVADRFFSYYCWKLLLQTWWQKKHCPRSYWTWALKKGHFPKKEVSTRGTGDAGWGPKKYIVLFLLQNI